MKKILYCFTLLIQVGGFAQELGNSVIGSIKLLRANTIPSSSARYYTTDIGQEGFWYYDAADVTSIDNTGTIIVSTNGKRFKRIYTGDLNVLWFGGAAMIAGADASAAIQTALNVGKPLFFPAGTYIVTTGLTYNTSTNTGGTILYGEGQTKTLFDNRVANGSLFTFKSTVSLAFQQTGRVQDIGIITTTRPAASNGIYIRGAWVLKFMNVGVNGVTGDGVRVEAQNGDKDGSVQLNFDMVYLRNNTGFGLHVLTAPNTSEISFLSVTNSFITNNSEGGIRWRGIVGQFINNGFTENGGVGSFQAYHHGGGGTNTAMLYMQGNDFENSYGRSLDINGVTQGTFINNQILANFTLTNRGQTELIKLGGNGGSNRNLKFENTFIRVTNYLGTHPPLTGFKVNADCQWTEISRTHWDVFGAAGQTRIEDNGENTKIFEDGREYPYPASALKTTLSVPSNYTPDMNKYKVHNVTLTAAGTYNILNPTSVGSSSGKEMILGIYNNSGGAVTINFGDQVITNGFSNPLNGERRVIHFLYNNFIGWVQVGGGNAYLPLTGGTLTGGLTGTIGNFSGSVTGITEATADNSTKLASTAFVKNQGYLTSSSGVTSITGTANQVIASASTGAVTLSLPQSIATNSSPTFSGLEILSSTNASTPAPVMTSLQKIRIANPTAGKTVYCSDCVATDSSTGVMQTYNGKQWKNHW